MPSAQMEAKEVELSPQRGADKDEELGQHRLASTGDKCDHTHFQAQHLPSCSGSSLPRADRKSLCFPDSVMCFPWQDKDKSPFYVHQSPVWFYPFEKSHFPSWYPFPLHCSFFQAPNTVSLWTKSLWLECSSPLYFNLQHTLVLIEIFSNPLSTTNKLSGNHAALLHSTYYSHTLAHVHTRIGLRFLCSGAEPKLSEDGDHAHFCPPGSTQSQKIACFPSCSCVYILIL